MLFVSCFLTLGSQRGCAFCWNMGLTKLSIYIFSEDHFPPPASCTGWRARGEVTNGVYKIDPDVTGTEAPVSVRCQMSLTSNKALTAVSHDREVNTSYSQSNQYEARCSYRVPIHYALPQSKITSIMNNSNQCQMDINVYCRHMLVTSYACYKGVNGADRPLEDILCSGKSVFGYGIPGLLT